MHCSVLFGSGIHCHIRWSDSSLDWKSFPTEEEAINLVGRIKKPNDTYAVVECDQTCQRCKDFKMMATFAA